MIDYVLPRFTFEASICGNSATLPQLRGKLPIPFVLASLILEVIHLIVTMTHDTCLMTLAYHHDDGSVLSAQEIYLRY